MKRFFFHLHECGDLTLDNEGREFPDMAAALIAATADARGLMAAEVLKGKLCLSCHIDVEDVESGERVRLPFRDAVALSGSSPI